MGRLNYLGPVTSKKVPGTKSYTDAVKATGISLEQVDATISSRTSVYADQAYIDAGDSAKASLTYVGQQDQLRIPTSWKNIANGATPLDSSGQVPLANLPLTGYTGDFQFGAASIITSNKAVSSTTATQTLAVITIPANNALVSSMTWVPLVWGYFEVYQNNGSSAAYIDVRLGNATTGTLVARGRAARGRMRWHPVNIMPLNSVELPKSTAAQTLYVVGRNGGSGAVEYSPFHAGALAMILPGTGA